MRNKLITIAAMLAVMVAMTGTALATTADLAVTNDSVTIPIGETGYQDVTMTLIPASPPALPIQSITIENLPAGISATITPGGIPGATTLIGPWASPKTWTVVLTNTGAANGDYTITYNVTYVNNQSRTRDATIQAGITTVPEFPTVALPVGAAIGLIFLFQSRRNKKE